MTQEQHIISAVETMTAAFHNRDIEAVMASYEPDATIVFEPGEPIVDRGVQRRKFEEAFALSPSFSYSGHKVFVTGDTAIHLAPWKMAVTAPDGTEIGDSGLSVAVLRKQADGRWLIVIDDPHGQHLLGRSGHAVPRSLGGGD